MAGIFHFVTALSLEDFGRAVQAALPRGRSQHDEGELLVIDRADLALERRGLCLTFTRHAEGASIGLRRYDRASSLGGSAPPAPPRSVAAIRAPLLQARLEKLLGDAALEVVQRWHFRGLS